MTEFFHCTPDQLDSLVRWQMKRVEQRISNAIKDTAVEAVRHIRKRAPKAFGDLSRSVHATRSGTPKTVVDAPHAGAVEQGSMPHMPDMEKLIAWVKLRGMQANNMSARQLSRRGPTTLEQARRVGSMLSERVVDGTYSPADSPTRVAEAIAKSIREHGTRPHWFVLESLGDIASTLDRNVRRALKK